MSKPMFFNSGDDMLTISCQAQDEKLMVFRKIPANGTYSETLKCDRDVKSLVSLLGRAARTDETGEINGLGLSYSQVVSALYNLCKNGDIKAKFVLQDLPQVQTIYKTAPTVGRPDMPGQ